MTSLEQTVIAATVGSDHTASYSITPDSAMRLSLLKDPRLICLHESWSSCKIKVDPISWTVLEQC